MVEREKAALQFLVSHQQFAKAIEPAVRDFDNPASCLLLWVTLEFAGLLSTALDMRDIAMRLNDRQRATKESPTLPIDNRRTPRWATRQQWARPDAERYGLDWCER